MPAFPGLTELIAGLGRMPTVLETNASLIVQDAAETMAAEVRAAYPIGPTKRVKGVLVPGGNLQGHVKVTRENAFRAVVKSTARHAYLFERGTVSRMTAKGWARGTMPKANVFIPAAIRTRRQMNHELIQLVESQTVPGMTGRLTVREDGRD